MNHRLPLLLALGLALSPTDAHAQAAPRISDGVTLPFRSVSAGDDASAIAVNPANLPFMKGPEGRVTVVYSSDEAPAPYRGYSLDLALPFWIFATGLRVDWMDPPNSAPLPFAVDNQGQSYNWVRWSQSVRIGDLLAIGNTLAWSSSENAALHSIFTAQTGLTFRPNRFVSAAVVARDWNSPEAANGDELKPSVDLAASFRPLGGHKMLEIGLEGSYRADDESWVPSANAAVGIPYVGRLRLGATLLDPRHAKVAVSTALEVNLESLQLTAGALFGNALGRDGTALVAGAAIRGFHEDPSVPLGSSVLRVRLEATPDVRQHSNVLRTFWRIADDDSIDGMVLVLRASPADSLAHAEELADAIRLMRARGKKVLCHLEDASGNALYVCSAADRIAMNPAGGLRFAGLSTRYLYFGGLLENLGVRADFVRIGAHKSAAEQFDSGPSDVANEDHRELLAAFENVYLDGILRGRRISRAQAKVAIAKGPFIAPEARDAGLIDQLAYEDEIDRYVEEVFGGRVQMTELSVPNDAPEYWRDPPKVAIVYLHGDMIDGNSRHIPILGMDLAGSYTIAAALKQAREDSTVKAVVFRIETGGGSSLAADVILREATLTAKVKPLIVSMGSRAASGGYYASVAAAEIFANRATVTGSIGIFYGKVDVVGLLDKIGIQSVALRTAPRADAESFFRPFTDEEHAELGRKVKQFYDLFVGRVAEGRKMPPAEVHAVAQGKVWTGDQARTRGLVDRIGGLRQALARARALGDLPADSPIVELPEKDKSLLELALELVGVPSLKSEALPVGWVPPPVLVIARALAPFMIYEPERPLALMDVVITEP
ncbi:MAG: signal peptide peptidase SppA [Polyangiaceae bacterium]